MPASRASPPQCWGSLRLISDFLAGLKTVMSDGCFKPTLPVIRSEQAIGSVSKVAHFGEDRRFGEETIQSLLCQ